MDANKSIAVYHLRRCQYSFDSKNYPKHPFHLTYPVPDIFLHFSLWKIYNIFLLRYFEWRPYWMTVRSGKERKEECVCRAGWHDQNKCSLGYPYGTHTNLLVIRGFIWCSLNFPKVIFWAFNKQLYLPHDYNLHFIPQKLCQILTISPEKQILLVFFFLFKH